MAPRTKSKAKSKAKPKTHTWAVNIDGAVTNIEAAGCGVQDIGSLEFYDASGDQLLLAVAPGHWSTCTIVPDQD